MKRPKSVTLLAFGVLILAGYYLLRVFLAARQWNFLSELFSASYVPYYLAATGLLWGSAGLFLGWGLLRGRRWAPRAYRILALVFAGYWWLDHLFLAVDPAVRVSARFQLGAMVVVLALTFWILARPIAKSFYGELND